MNKLITLLLAVLLISCGAKTLNKDVTSIDSLAKEKEKLEISESEKENTTVKTEEQSNYSSVNTSFDFSNGITIRPIDHTKPSSFTDSKGNTTNLQNAEVVTNTKWKTIYKKDTVSENKVLELESEQTKNKNIISEKDKEIRRLEDEVKKLKTREQFSIKKMIVDFGWWWILIILLVYFGYKWIKGTNPVSLVSGLIGKIKLPII